MPIDNGKREERSEMKKGDLYIKFDIRFPRTLTESQRQRIEAILEKGEI